MKALGDAMADATGYTSQYGFELYDTSGTTDDYTYAAQGGYAYTIEIGPQGGQFHMPYETGVVDQWTGTPGTPSEGKGLREALLLAGRERRRPRASRGPHRQGEAGHGPADPQGLPDRDQRALRLRAGLPELLGRRHAARLRRLARPARLRRQAREHDDGAGERQVQLGRAALDAAVRRRAGRGRRPSSRPASRRRSPRRPTRPTPLPSDVDSEAFAEREFSSTGTRTRSRST